MNMKYRHPDELIIQIIPEYFDSLLGRKMAFGGQNRASGRGGQPGRALLRAGGNRPDDVHICRYGKFSVMVG
jgi:hypothetical protein